MLGANCELLSPETTHRVHCCRLRPLHKGGGDVNDHVFLLDGLVDRQVLTLEIGVDRHLEGAPSTDGRNEIDRHHPAAFAGEVQGTIRQVQVHGLIEPRSGASCSSKLKKELVRRGAEDHEQQDHRPHQEISRLHCRLRIQASSAAGIRMESATLANTRLVDSNTDTEDPCTTS